MCNICCGALEQRKLVLGAILVLVVEHFVIQFLIDLNNT